MQLTSQPDNDTLGLAVMLSELPEEKVKTDVAANVLGAALVLRRYADEAYGGLDIEKLDLFAWRDIVLRQGRYRYRLIPGKAFTAYGYEQQAAMMEDWMRMEADLKPHWGPQADKTSLAGIVPFL